MGRRSRRRNNDRFAPPRLTSQTARVRVSDEMWRDFRQAIGDRHASEVLAQYVEQEVSKFLSRQLDDNRALTTDEMATAIRRVAELERSCRRLTEQLSWLATRT